MITLSKARECAVSALVLSATLAGVLRTPTAEAASTYSVAALDSRTGFRLDGVAPYDDSGYAVSGVGDVNGDGFDDVIVGAPFTDHAGENSGSVYIVFGRPRGQLVVSLSDLDGTNGFRVDGGGISWHASAAGDVNADGFDDVILGGRVVLFGRGSGFPAAMNVSTIDGTNGFWLAGGSSGSGAGDVNGDGVDDVVVGAPDSEKAYLLYGRSGAYGPTIDLTTLDATRGVRLDGVAGEDTGRAVSGAGDIDDDGLDDVIVGAPLADVGSTDTGSTYVVFGRSSLPGTLALSALDGNSGFRLDGASWDDRAGSAVSGAGDVNADGFDDVVIGGSRAGYVVLGRGGLFPAMLALSALDGANGFRLGGPSLGGHIAQPVSDAGDLNGDGFDDVIIGAPEANSSFVVLGRGAGFDATVELQSLDGTNGFRIVGEVFTLGDAVSAAGDFDGDGIDDVIVGDHSAGPLVGSNFTFTGRSYVYFGNEAPVVSGIGPGRLPDVLEDGPGAAGARADVLSLPYYLDNDPLAGAAISTSPGESDGIWQHSLDMGANWQNVPSSLATSAALVLRSESLLRFVPAADFHGDSPALTVRVWDGADHHDPGAPRDIRTSIDSLGGFASDANLLTLVAPVVPVNDAPSFSASSPPNVAEDAPPQTIAPFAAFAAGPTNEADQFASYEISNLSAPTMFSLPPTVSAGGTLSYALAPDAHGVAAFDLRVRDSGGTSNGGIDVSPFQSFSIVVEPINDAPSFVATNPPPSDEDSGEQAVANIASAFTPGPANESSQQLVAYDVTAVSDASLFAVPPSVANDGTLTYTSAPNAHGTATFQLRVRDSGGVPGVDESASASVSVTIRAVNDAPTFAANDPPPVRDDDGLVEIVGWATFDPGAANEQDQVAVQFHVDDLSRPEMFASPPRVIGKGSTGTLQFAPARGMSGTSTFRVRVRDSGGTANGGVDTGTPQAFAITVRGTADALFGDSFE